MPVYSFIAVRDGDIVHEQAEWPSEHAAEVWATGLMALHFGLNPGNFDGFEDIVAETDGCELIELGTDKVAEAAKSLLVAVASQVFAPEGPPLLHKDGKTLACTEAALRLTKALRDAGHHVSMA